MGSIAPAKILVVLVVALVVLGPERLPQVAKQAGKAWGDFRRFREHLETEVKGALGEDSGSIGGALDEFRETVHGTLASPKGSSVDEDGSQTGAAGAQPRPPGWRQGPGAARDRPLSGSGRSVALDDPGLN